MTSGALFCAGVVLLGACGADVRIEYGAPDGGLQAGAGSGGAGGQGSGQGGQSGAEPAVGLEVLYEGEDSPSAIALDDNYIYWASLEVVRRAPLAGGAPVTLASGRYLRGILPDRDHLYFLQSAEGTGSIQRVPKTGGDAEWLASALQPTALTIRGDDLFWSDQAVAVGEGTIHHLALDGSATSVLATGLWQPSSLVIDGEHLYFRSAASACSIGGDSPGCFGGGIQRLPIGGGDVEPISENSPRGDFVFANGSMYWLAASPPRIMLRSPDGAEREVAGGIVQQGVSGDGSLRTDGIALYWADDDKVLRMPFETAEVSLLVSALEGAYDVAIRGDWAYVAEGGRGRIVRVATDGSANRPSGPITGPCPEPLGSTEELAVTPRADEDLEQLALSLEPERITASQATYDRLVSDAAAIRALTPALADIGYRSPYDARELYVALTDIGAQSIAAGEYSAWDCLNDAYRAGTPVLNESFGNSSAMVQLGGVFNVPLVAELYSSLPEVREATPSYGVGDGSTWCASRDGERYDYIVDRAGGDCPSGCTEHEMHGFTSEAAGQVTSVGVWSSTSGDPAPAWVSELCN